MDAFILGATVTALGLTAKYIWFAKNSDSLIDALNEVVDNVDDVNVIGLCRSYKKFLTSYCRSVSKVIIEIDELKTSRKAQWHNNQTFAKLQLQLTWKS